MSNEEETIINNKTTFSRLIKTFSKNFLSVCIYLNVVNGCDYYDTVVHRKVKTRNSKDLWKRGANLKPTDLCDIIELLTDAKEYLSGLGVKTN